MKSTRVTQNISKHLFRLAAERIGSKNVQGEVPVSFEMVPFLYANPSH